MSCRVAIFEDDPAYRASLELVLGTLPRFTFAGSYDSPSEPIDELEQGGAATFDLALMDIEMPELDGITATRRLKELVPAECQVSDTARLGLAPALVESCAFAWLAMRTLSEKPGNLPAVTGASGEANLCSVRKGK